MVLTTTDGTVAGEIADNAWRWYESAGVWAILLTVLLFALFLTACISIARKAGYSGWWGALFVLVPVLSWILIALLAVLKWPTLKERDEALGVLKENGLVLPSRERVAVKEAERRKKRESEAQRNVELAQAERKKAEAAKARFAGADASSSPAPAVRADSPSETTTSTPEGGSSGGGASSGGASGGGDAS